MAPIAIIHNHPIHYKHLLFQAMRSQGLDFEVLFVSRGSSIRIESGGSSTNDYPFRTGHDGEYENHPRASTARFIWSALSELNPPLVIISGYYDVAGWTAWLWARIHKRPRILWNETNHFDSHRSWLKEAAKGYYVRNFDFAHVYGISNREYLERLGLAPDRIVIKRAVTDTTKFSPQPAAPRHYGGPIDLLYVGRLSEEKNLEFLVRAVAAIPQDRDHPTLVLSIVGYGPQEALLKRLTSSLNAASIIKFEGPLKQSELPQRYSEADAFILPSVREPWGLVALEAILCELPILVSSQCGCARDLVNMRTGWTFSPYDLPALTQLIEDLTRIPGRTLEDMGRAGRELGLAYSPDNCAAVVKSTIVAALGSAGVVQEECTAR